MQLFSISNSAINNNYRQNAQAAHRRCHHLQSSEMSFKDLTNHDATSSRKRLTTFTLFGQFIVRFFFMNSKL